MAELSASIIGIVAAGAKVTLVLYQLASDVGSAAKEARLIASEIASFCAVVKTLGETLGKIQTSRYYAHCNNLVSDMTTASLEMFSEILDACKSLMDISKGKDGKFGLYGRVQWALLQKPKILLLRAGLEAYKSNLALMLGTLNTTEKVNRRMSLPVTPEVVAEDEQDRAVLQTLENEHRTSMINIDQARRLMEGEASAGVGQDKAPDGLPDLKASPGSTPVLTSPPSPGDTDDLLGSARDEIDSVRSSLFRSSTFDSDVLPDQISRHSKALSQLMSEDRHRISQRWSSLLSPLSEGPDSEGYQPLQDEDWSFVSLSEPYVLPTPKTPELIAPSTYARSPSPASSAGQRASDMSDAFYGIVRTWLMGKSLEDRRIILGTLMNEVCVAPKSLGNSSPQPAKSRPFSLNPTPAQTQQPQDVFVQYRQKTREINGLVEKQVADFAAKAQAEGLDGKLPLIGAPGLSIDLGYQKILRLPHEIVEALKSSLERISLSHNRLSGLPSSISMCERLRYVNLRHNNFVVIPKYLLNLPHLEILDMSRNLLMAIPDTILNVRKTLKVLSVSQNKISRLPFALAQMTELEIFRYDGNQITFPTPEVLNNSSSMFTTSSGPGRSESSSPGGNELFETERLKKYLGTLKNLSQHSSFLFSGDPTQAGKSRKPRFPVVAAQPLIAPAPFNTSKDIQEGFDLPKRDSIDFMSLNSGPKTPSREDPALTPNTEEPEVGINQAAVNTIVLSAGDNHTALDEFEQGDRLSSSSPKINTITSVASKLSPVTEEHDPLHFSNTQATPAHQRSRSQDPPTKSLPDMPDDPLLKRRSYLYLPNSRSKRSSVLLGPSSFSSSMTPSPAESKSGG